MVMIHAQKREKSESSAYLRKQGNVPAVLYGAGREPMLLTIDARDFAKIWKEAGESKAIKININGETVDADALIQDVARDPVRGQAIHIDFLSIDLKKPIEVTVPLVFSQEAPAVKHGIGIMVKVMHEIEVLALPNDLPQEISIDVSKLENIDDQITVADIDLPKTITIITKGEEVIALIAAMNEEEPEEVVTVDLSAIEVEKKGKKDEEGTEEEEK